jgi:DNA-binding transcriptional LysR family regulator
MNLRHLRTFVLIADSGGIARASGRLHLSSPAASRQILALENELRVQLFDRIGRRLQLTPEGEDLLTRSRRLLNDAESLTERARSLKSGHTGLLRVGAAPQVIESFLAPFVPSYRRRHPGVDVHLVEDASGNLPIRLERGEVHVIEVPADDDRFPRRLSHPTHVLAVMPREHRLGRRAVLEVADIAEEPLLLQRRESQARGWVEAAFRTEHIRPNVLLESAVPHTLVALAAGGYGVAIIPSNVAIFHKGVRAAPLVVNGASIGINATR